MRNTLRNVGWDTGAVLFLLSLECGRAVQLVSAEGLLMVLTIAMLASLPYFLPSAPQVTFSKWLAGRSVIVFSGIVLGLALPGSMQYLPMTLLILASMVSCYVQFYGLMRLRLAK